MAVHSDTVRAPEVGLEDLLGTMALTKPISFLKRYASVAAIRLFETMLHCSISKFDLRDAAMRCLHALGGLQIKCSREWLQWRPVIAPPYRFCHERFSRLAHTST